MGRQILIVDDSQIARSIIRRILEINGFTDVPILEAKNGTDALNILKTQKCELVITDLNMPDMNGEELLKRIKSSPRLNDLPVVVITSLGNKAREQKLISEQAAAVFTKPLSIPEISQFIKNNLNEEQDENYEL